MNTELIKMASGLVASISVGTVVSHAIKSTTPAVVTPVTKVLVTIGTFVAVGMAGAAATSYTEKELDKLEEWYNKNYKR